METALETLIRELEETLEITVPARKEAYEFVIERAKLLLPAEKKQINGYAKAFSKSNSNPIAHFEKKTQVKEKSEMKVMTAYHFPNGMVAAYGTDDKQIPELQGVYTELLHEQILKRSDENTELKNFPEL